MSNKRWHIGAEAPLHDSRSEASDPLSDFTATVLTLRRMQTEAALAWLDALSEPVAR